MISNVAKPAADIVRKTLAEPSIVKINFRITDIFPINRTTYSTAILKKAPVLGIRKKPGFLKLNPAVDEPYQAYA
jgi:hypothetical protein